MKRIVVIIGIGVCLAGCSGERSDARAAVDDATIPARAATSPATTDSSFTATLSGALERELAGDALAGSKYNRYHINMASRATAPGDPAVVIAFGRTDANLPAPGTYPLAAGSEDGFRGTVEVYGNPQREFDISSGELVILSSRDDMVEVRFSLTATERQEEYGAPASEVRAEGTFKTKPAS
jgi:hypothetical protein